MPLREKQRIDWAVLTVIRRRGVFTHQNSSHMARPPPAVWKLPVPAATIHSSHFAVTDGDLVGIGFVCCEAKSKLSSRYNLLQEVYINMQNQIQSQAATGDAVRLILI